MVAISHLDVVVDAVGATLDVKVGKIDADGRTGERSDCVCALPVGRVVVGVVGRGYYAVGRGVFTTTG